MKKSKIGWGPTHDASICELDRKGCSRSRKPSFNQLVCQFGRWEAKCADRGPEFPSRYGDGSQLPHTWRNTQGALSGLGLTYGPWEADVKCA